ncbi:MAG: 30S ribosomal protein S5 [Thermoproteota archaeon]|nr:30S ribosomal protein S5 [Candidatus Brockarchaeota archaeon]MBO3768727.1 30S ribosomal protein S5 [Candidatus Brockarchaeota archaeon]MBO3801045.1 30S ribosomal protein S5 [Candidatus Brockarchaeota archaeon]
MSSNENSVSQETYDEGLSLVKAGQINTIEEYFERGYKIRDPQIVDLLLSKQREELVALSPVQKQTDAGEKTRIRAVVVIGDEEGHVGVGSGKATQVNDAIAKASRKAKLSIVPVRRGCGSWECKCNQPHSIPFRVDGKEGSVKIELYPAPKGLGLVAGDTMKVVLRLAGVKDVWSRSEGDTSTSISSVFATYKALKKTYTFITPEEWGV